VDLRLHCIRLHDLSESAAAKHTPEDLETWHRKDHTAVNDHTHDEDGGLAHGRTERL
jgi:hypothetical protein